MVRPSFDDTYDYDGYFHGVANKAQIAALSNQTWTSPTIAGATVKLLSFDETEVKLDYDTTGTNYISLATTYISSATGVLGFDVSTAAAVSPAAQVASNILKISNGSSVRLDATAYGAGGNIFKVLTTDTGGYADVLEFDTSTSADITAGLQVTTDGYLQARVQEPVLALTTDSPVKLQVVESGNYSSWASGLQFDLSTEVDLAPESQITTGGYLQTRCKKIKLVLTTDSPAKLQLAASSNYGSWVNGPTVGECT